MSKTPGVTRDWLMEDAIEQGAGLSLARMTVDPGVTSQAHRHPNCAEAIHVLSGQVEQRKGAQWVELATGDTDFDTGGRDPPDPHYWPRDRRFDDRLFVRLPGLPAHAIGIARS